MNLYINASPKIYKSSTNCFIRRLKNNDDKVIFLYKDDYKDIDYTLYKSIIICSPLYADSVTSKLVEYMEYIAYNGDISNKLVYFVSNSGFLEYEQNYISDEIVSNFAENNKAIFMGVLNIGSGPILGESNKGIYKLLSIDFYLKINRFKKAIAKNKKIYLDTRIHPVSKRMYVKFANISWHKKRSFML